MQQSPEYIEMTLPAIIARAQALDATVTPEVMQAFIRRLSSNDTLMKAFQEMLAGD